MPRSSRGEGLCAGRIDWCITSQQSEIKGFVLLHGILATVCDVPNFQLSELGQWRYWRKGSQTDQNFLVQTSFQWSSFLLRDKYLIFRFVQHWLWQVIIEGRDIASANSQSCPQIKSNFLQFCVKAFSLNTFVQIPFHPLQSM